MELVHDRRGTGEPLVLLHGIGSRWQVFEPVIDPLAAHHEVWSLDMPGFGASPPMPAGRLADIAGLTDAVAEWIAEQGLERPHVAGNSTGAGIALELAARGVVSSATALAPIGFWSPRERAFCQASIRFDRFAVTGARRPLADLAQRSALGRAMFFAQVCSKPGRLTETEALETIHAFGTTPSFDDTLAAFKGYVAPATAADDVPVTIVWGSRDGLLLPRQARRAQRLLPRARHVMVKGASHLLMSDAPEESVDAILATTRAARVKTAVS
jgi:pimeloyl-ACP methyl ester carboxylesterase